jgi:hypothetical protein
MTTKLYRILFEQEENKEDHQNLMPDPEDIGEPAIEPMSDEEMSDWLKSKYYRPEGATVNEMFEAGALNEDEGSEETPTVDIVVTPESRAR